MCCAASRATQLLMRKKPLPSHSDYFPGEESGSAFLWMPLQCQWPPGQNRSSIMGLTLSLQPQHSRQQHTWSISRSWALAPGHSMATLTMSDGGGIASLLQDTDTAAWGENQKKKVSRMPFFSFFLATLVV